jgi:hypothetical protein
MQSRRQKMMEKYARCADCDRFVRDKKETLCNRCKKRKLLFREKRDINIGSQYCPDEQLFEDDPRALKEIEYGKVYKTSTHVFGRSILDDLG